MPTEVREAGYEGLRDFIVSPDGWRYVELRSEDGTVIGRFDLYGDEASWIDASGQTLQAEVNLTLPDERIDPPTTITQSLSYDQEEGGEILAEDDFDEGIFLEISGDEVIVTHEVQVPQTS